MKNKKAESNSRSVRGAMYSGSEIIFCYSYETRSLSMLFLYDSSTEETQYPHYVWNLYRPSSMDILKNQITQSMEMLLFDIYRIQFSAASFTVVFAYLIEIFVVPVNVDIASTVTHITAINKTNVDALLHLLKRMIASQQ